MTVRGTTLDKGCDKMLLDEEVIIIWNNSNFKHYANLGYSHTKNGELFSVNVNDLPTYSNIVVNVGCDICGCKNSIKFSDYNMNIKRNKLYRCRACSIKFKKLKTTKPIRETHSWMLDYIINVNDGDLLSYGSNKKILMKCPYCGKEKTLSPNRLNTNGFSCTMCKSDGISYPEKFIRGLLNQFELDYICELSKKNFSWCNKYRYDFYIPSINSIIETHGLQHYEDTTGNFKSSLKDQSRRDNIKKELAIKNNISNYVILDCRKSEVEWIKQSIMNSELPYLLNFKEEDIDWININMQSMNNIYMEVISMLKDGMTTKEIAERLKITPTCVCNYRRSYEKETGEFLGRYKTKTKKEPKSMKNKVETHGDKKVCVIDKTSGVMIATYESISELCRKSIVDFGVEFTISSVSKCCNGLQVIHKGYSFKFA